MLFGSSPSARMHGTPTPIKRLAAPSSTCKQSPLSLSVHATLPPYSPPTYSRTPVRATSSNGQSHYHLGGTSSSSRPQPQGMPGQERQSAPQTPQQRTPRDKAFVAKTPYQILSEPVRAHYRQHVYNLLHLHRKKRSLEKMVLQTRGFLRWRHAVEQSRQAVERARSICQAHQGAAWQRVADRLDRRWAFTVWSRALPLYAGASTAESRALQKLQKSRLGVVRRMFATRRAHSQVSIARRFARWVQQVACLKRSDYDYDELMLKLSLDVERRLVSSGQAGTVFNLAQGAVTARRDVAGGGAEAKTGAVQQQQRRAYVWPHPGLPGKPAIYSAVGKPVPRRAPPSLENDDWSLWV